MTPIERYRKSLLDDGLSWARWVLPNGYSTERVLVSSTWHSRTYEYRTRFYKRFDRRQDFREAKQVLEFDNQVECIEWNAEYRNDGSSYELTWFDKSLRSGKTITEEMHWSSDDN